MFNASGILPDHKGSVTKCFKRGAIHLLIAGHICKRPKNPLVEDTDLMFFEFDLCSARKAALSSMGSWPNSNPFPGAVRMIHHGVPWTEFRCENVWIDSINTHKAQRGDLPSNLYIQCGLDFNLLNLSCT